MITAPTTGPRLVFFNSVMCEVAGTDNSKTQTQVDQVL